MIEELENATERERKQIDTVRELLRKHPSSLDAKGNRADKIAVYCFRDEWGGVRISEVSASWHNELGTFGASWMRSDLDCAGVIFAFEQYLLYCLLEVDDQGDGAIYDPEQEARRSLLYWLAEKRDYNTLPAWEERTHNPLAA